MSEAGAAPWLCHLSFIKPHWSYIVPVPYHDMFGQCVSTPSTPPITLCSKRF